MTPTAEELASALAAINGAEGVSDESKQAFAQALASDFAEDVPDDDPAVDGAIDDAGMSEEYAAANDDEKKGLRARFARLLTKQRAKAFAAAKPATAVAPAKAEPKGFSLADLKSVMREEITKALPPQGRVAAPNGNPTGGTKTSADPTGFSARVQAIKKDKGVSETRAMLMAKAEDSKAFNAWIAAGKPQ